MLLPNTSTCFSEREKSLKERLELQNYAIFVVNMVKSKTRDKILILLKKHPQGLTIMEIAELLDVNRITIAKYVYGLNIEGLIKQRQIGPAKLCYLKKGRIK
jgi:predicted transcriptional regulator